MEWNARVSNEYIIVRTNYDVIRTSYVIKQTYGMNTRTKKKKKIPLSMVILLTTRIAHASLSIPI